MASLAAPIRDVHGEVVAAISIGAPVARFGAMPRRRHAPALVEAGEAISRRLGWNPESGADVSVIRRRRKARFRSAEPS